MRRKTAIDPRRPLSNRAASAVLCLLGCAFSAAAAQAQGQGDLTVTPTRIVLEGRARSAQIALINRAVTTATYRVSFTQMRMSAQGHFEEIAEPGPGELFADKLVRYSPRQVTLEPGVAQTVRFMLRKPADLPAGEYRSHLLLYAVPSENGNSIETRAAEVGEGNLAVQLTPIYRIAVPVIVRHGELGAQARLSDLKFDPGHDEDAPPAISFLLNRQGDRSLYGDVTVSFLADGDDTETVVGRLAGLAVYTPNPVRSVTLPIRPPEGVSLRKGRLKVAFSEEAGPNGAENAESELPLS